MMRMTGFTTNQIMGSAPLQYEDLVEFQANTRQLQIDADQRAGANAAMTALAYPAQEQQRTLQMAAESLVQEMLPEVMELQDPSSLEQLAVQYDQIALDARDGIKAPGQDHLTEEDYLGIAQWIREQVNILFPPNNPADPFARPGAGIFTPGGQQDLNSIRR